MIKNKFIITTLILIISGFITKFLGMITKIIITRMIGTNGISLYMMIMPTFNLFIVLAQMGFPIAISKIVSEGKTNNKKLIISSTYLSFFITIILMLFLLMFGKNISNLLHNQELYLPIISIGLTLPFISISSIIRSYFFGKEKIIPHVVSNIIEQIVRIILFFVVLPKLRNYNLIMSICFIILSNIISETISILILYFFLPKKIKIETLKPDISIIKDILNISIPTTGSRLIGTIGYFFEPILFTTMLLHMGFTNKYITYNYGVVTGYVFPLLLIPSFFSMAISQSTIPIISKAMVNNNKKYIKSKVRQSIIFSLLIGLFFTTIYMLFPDKILKFVYNTNEGLNYLKICTPFFIFHYIQSPIISILQSMGKAKESFNSTVIGMIIKTILMIILPLFNFKIYSLIIPTIVNMIFVTVYNYIKINKILKY